DSCGGAPLFTRVDPQVLFTFTRTGPEPPFAACWSGSLYAPQAGTYLIGTGTSEPSAVDLDGRRVAGSGEDLAADLGAGWRLIRRHAALPLLVARRQSCERADAPRAEPPRVFAVKSGRRTLVAESPSELFVFVDGREVATRTLLGHAGPLARGPRGLFLL